MERSNVFISYSRKDRVWLDKLQTMLKPLVRQKNTEIDIWDDEKIAPGAEWRTEISKALDAANIAVLLVSANFLASDFIVDHELPKLLDSAQKKGLKILWVYVNYCAYEDTEIFHYQAVHDINRPLESLTESEQSQVFKFIYQQIKVHIEALQKKSSARQFENLKYELSKANQKLEQQKRHIESLQNRIEELHRDIIDTNVGIDQCYQRLSEYERYICQLETQKSLDISQNSQSYTLTTFQGAIAH